MPLTKNDIAPIRVYGEDFREEVAVMYNVAEKLGLIDWLKTDPLYFWTHPNVEKIITHPDVLRCGHSGATEALCLRIVKKMVSEL